VIVRLAPTTARQLPRATTQKARFIVMLLSGLLPADDADYHLAVETDKIP
jgi:hypothetical protein